MFKIVYSQSMVQPYYTRQYKSRKCAQNACDKLNARERKRTRGGMPVGKDAYTVYSQDEYEAATRGKGEWKQSVCGGKVWVSLGTPACCDPSTETYWSM